MSTLDAMKAKFEQKLDERIVTARRRRADAECALLGSAPVDRLPDIGQSADLSALLVEFDALLEARIGRQRAAPPAVGTPITPGGTSTADFGEVLGVRAMDDLEWLCLADQTIENDFDLRRLPKHPGIVRAPKLIATEGEFRSRVERAIGKVEWRRPVPAVYLPDDGCLVNEAAIRAALPPDQQSREQMQVKALEALAVEKWGWGFFLEYTQIGRLLVDSGHWREAAARRLHADLSGVQTSVAASVLRSSTLTRLGWGIWIREYLLFKARHPIAQASLVGLPRATKIIEMLAVIGRTLENASQVYAIANAVRYLLVQTELAPRGAHLAVRAIHDNLETVDDLVARRWGDSLSGMLAFLIFSGLESKVGMFCMPYALLIAGHVDGQALLDGKLDSLKIEPRLTVDTRLALLTSLDSRIKYDLAGMAVAAWEEVELDSPKEYFRD